LHASTLRQDKLNFKNIALPTSNKINKDFFIKLILFSDIISKELIFWMQENMAINGTLLQVYSSLNSSLQYHLHNRENLGKYITPTRFYHAFYQTFSQDGTITLIPFRRNAIDYKIGKEIKLVKTKIGLFGIGTGMTPTEILCIDKEKEDVLHLYRYLIHLAGKKNAADDLFKIPLLPYISSLCRWEKKIPNCQSLETFIVDSQGNIKTCLNGTTIGQVGISFNRLRENLNNIHQAAQKDRDCLNCKKLVECSGCIFPDPLSAVEFCHLKKGSETVKSAGLLRTFDSLKEF
jgi:radical SAM protein with 4Fe4S-binding SPASM domain